MSLVFGCGDDLLLQPDGGAREASDSGVSELPDAGVARDAGTDDAGDPDELEVDAGQPSDGGEPSDAGVQEARECDLDVRDLGSTCDPNVPTCDGPDTVRADLDIQDVWSHIDDQSLIIDVGFRGWPLFGEMSRVFFLSRSMPADGDELMACTAEAESTCQLVDAVVLAGRDSELPFTVRAGDGAPTTACEMVFLAREFPIARLKLPLELVGDGDIEFDVRTSIARSGLHEVDYHRTPTAWLEVSNTQPPYELTFTSLCEVTCELLSSFQ